MKLKISTQNICYKEQRTSAEVNICQENTALVSGTRVWFYKEVGRSGFVRIL